MCGCSSTIILPLTLSYSSEINSMLNPPRVSLPLKKHRDISSEGCAADSNGCVGHIFWFWTCWVGCGSLLQTIMAVLCALKILKRHQTAITICSGLPHMHSENKWLLKISSWCFSCCKIAALGLSEAKLYAWFLTSMHLSRRCRE